MTRFIYDQFNKDYLETLLTPYGEVQVAKQLSDEIREIDLYFNPTVATLPTELGILAKLAATKSLFEPYRNPVTPREIGDCLLKLLAVRAQLYREGNRNKQTILDSDLPRLWIITPTASKAILSQCGGEIQSDWGEGIYFLANLLRAAIIVIHQLPSTSETLWLRLLGRGKVQQRAIEELINLSPDNPLKSVILEILYTLQKNLEVNQPSTNTEESELIMRLAPLYQEDRARAKTEEALSLIQRLLTKKLGNINPDLITTISQLNLESLETLAEDLMDFTSQADLENWLRNKII
ncbi:MAG: DUF4351 domain-containing protein [Gloeocapsa sp. DLM2.Bin57]|nr:MAG: DUF4351 domain-containing protein [Gloeocapsa sp. DLM2.Bin57]